MQNARLSVLAVLSIAAPFTGALADPYSFQTITIPNGPVTVITGINDVGQISGNFRSAVSGYGQGFLETLSSGTVTPVANNGFYTVAEGINNSGQVTGYSSISGGTFGFVRDPVTGINNVLPPEGGFPTGYAAFGINDAGQVVGNFPQPYHSTRADASFLYNPVTATSSTFVDPAAGTASGYMSGTAPYGYTHAYDINNRGQIVGAAFTPISATTYGQTGFLRDVATNTYTVIDVPGSTATSAIGINDNGQVVGDYQIGPASYAFLFTLSTGLYTTLTDPGVTSINADGINNAGQIVGSFIDGSGTQTGFIATPAAMNTTVPEPASLALLATAIGTLAWARRKASSRAV